MARTMRCLVAVAAVFMVSGCSGDAVAPVSGAGGQSDHAVSFAPKQTRVMSKGFTIAGPRGFCIDEAATRETPEGAFVMLGSCAAISGHTRDAQPRLPALLTASVVPAAVALDDGALDRMVAYLASPAGRAALARGDDAENVVVLDLVRDAGLVLVHARDGTRAGDLDGEYWRAVFETGGQLVTVTVSGYRNAPLPPEHGARLTREFVGAIRSTNAPGRAAPGGGLASFFNRLL